MNGLLYEYYYNGGGVAVGDFNNDNLPDIYFVSNLEANQMYLNLGGMKFKNVTEEAGVSGKAAFPGGVTTVDINGDGLLDIYVSASGKFEDPDKRRNELYINQGVNEQGIPVFRENAAKYHLDIEAFSTQAAFFDYDRDKDLDMFLINHDVEIYGNHQIATYIHTQGTLSGERLYRNDNGIFRDVTDTSGVINNRLGFGLGVAVADLNNDHWPDVYVSHDFSGNDHLYLNNRDGTFQEVVSQATKHISFFSMGNDVADYNNDGWIDIMTVDMVSEDNYGIKTSMSGMNPDDFYKLVNLGLHHQYMYNTLQFNNGPCTPGGIPYFSEVGQMAGVSSTDWSWAPLFFDMNNDGYQDLFVSNGIKRDFRNNDFVQYHQKVRDKLLTQKTVDQEAYINHMMSRMPTREKPNYFFINNQDLTFQKMTDQWKMDSVMTSSNGAAYADFDNDGDVDLVVNNTDDYAHVYQNNTPSSSDSRFLKVKLQGVSGNTQGLGARVKLTFGPQQQTREQYLTRGFQSAVSEVLHFGVGKTQKIDQLEITWPDGSYQSLEHVTTNQTLVLDQSEAELATPKNRPEHQLFSLDSQYVVDYHHVENEFDDFARESLLPHRYSRLGPALAVGDYNGDTRDDVFVGGAKGQAGSLFYQTGRGEFTIDESDFLAEHTDAEDISAAFFDADADGDLDLYVVSGGNEDSVGSARYQDRIYQNRNGTFTYSPEALPEFFSSGSCVKPYDYDKDGDLDLFVGGRLIPGRYPHPANSYLLENTSAAGIISFEDVTNEKAPSLRNLGMATDAVWVDMDNDARVDLVVVGEWMPVTVLVNKGQQFVDQTDAFGLSDETGWWYSVSSADFDQDGDQDLVAGNLGLNYKYRASKSEPFGVYANDFDHSGDLDIVLSYYNEGGLFPLRGRECSSNEMPFIKEKFATYDAFGKATLPEVYGSEELQKALSYQATTFASTYYENVNGRSFRPHELPALAQFSSLNTMLVRDINGDSHLDLVALGNMHSAEVETPRNDASYGAYLVGDGQGNFRSLWPQASGLFVDGDVKNASFINLPNGGTGIVMAANSANVRIITLENSKTKKMKLSAK